MLAIGNNELGAEVGETAQCPHCGTAYHVEYGVDAETGLPTNIIGFVRCGSDSYLVAVGGREYQPRKRR